MEVYDKCENAESRLEWIRGTESCMKSVGLIRLTDIKGHRI